MFPISSLSLRLSLATENGEMRESYGRNTFLSGRGRRAGPTPTVQVGSSQDS